MKNSTYAPTTTRREISARFSSTCPRCQQRIPEGARILWAPGEKATHVSCQLVEAPVAAPIVEAPRLTIEEAGVYVLPNGAICKVQANKAKTHTYALRWTEIRGERLNENDAHVKGEYVYESGLIRTVSAQGRKMNLD